MKKFRCASWVPNGFCNNNFYTCAQKQQFCALSCNIGSCNPQTTCSGSSGGSVNCPDADSRYETSLKTCFSDFRCPSWVGNGFCGSTFYTTAQKCQFCQGSCNLCNSSLCGAAPPSSNVTTTPAPSNNGTNNGTITATKVCTKAIGKISLFESQKSTIWK